MKDRAMARMRSLALGLGLVTCACIYEEEPVKRPASNVSSGVNAARQIAAARCERESTCRGFGPGRTFADRSACFTAFERDGFATFANCRYGVKPGELQACANEARSEACGGIAASIDWLNRSFVCRAPNLCLQ